MAGQQVVAGQQVAAAAGVGHWMPQTLAGLVELAVALLIQMGRMNSEQELLVDLQMHWILQSHQLAVEVVQTDLGNMLSKIKHACNTETWISSGNVIIKHL